MKSGLVALVPPWVVTKTWTAPAAVAGGAVASIVVESMTVKLVASSAPNLTALAERKFVPVITTGAPARVELSGVSISTETLQKHSTTNQWLFSCHRSHHRVESCLHHYRRD